MSNTSSRISAFSHNSIRSPRNPISSSDESSDIGIRRDMKREEKHIKQLASSFDQKDRQGYIDNDDDVINFLTVHEQLENQNRFANGYIKNMRLGSNVSGLIRDKIYNISDSSPQVGKFLQESPQMLEEEEDEEQEEEDPEYTYEKVTETGLNSDDEYLEEEYDSEFDGEVTERRTRNLIQVNQIISEIEHWTGIIVKSKILQWLVACVVFLALIILLASAIVHTNNTTRFPDTRTNHYTQYIPVDSLTEVNSKLRRFQNQLDELNSKQNSLLAGNDKLSDDFHRTQQNVNKNWEQLNRKYANIQSYVTEHLVDNESLAKEFNGINGRLRNFEEQLKRGKEIDIDHAKHLSDIFQQVSVFESSLENANNKIEELLLFKNRISEVFSTLKDDVLQSLLEKLPSVVPIISNTEGQIQMFPEVYDYLSEVIRNTVKIQMNSIDLKHVKLETDLSWENFLKQNEIEFNQYLSQFVTNELKFVKREDFENILVENFKANRDKLDRELLKIRKLMDQSVNNLESKISRMVHTSNDNMDHSLSTSELLIEHLINKKMDENILKVEGRSNYADAEQGLTIIKSLTSDNIKTHLRKRKSIAERALFGWYDFLRRIAAGYQNTSIRKSIDNPKNVLLDNKSYWVTLASDSHLGIRLNKDILLTDILFKHPRNDNPLVLTSAPRKISIYVKPVSRKKQSFLKKKFSSVYDQDFIPSLSAFTKITEFEYDINNSHIFQFVHLPKEYLLLNMQVDEIYIDIESNWGHDQITSLHNIKVFGINNNDVKTAKKFLKLGDDISTEEVIEEIRERYVDKATYAVNHNLEQGIDTKEELGLEL